jgi:murein DD-endopeptidase MepM/ murein hydrolase activator NlpD
MVNSLLRQLAIACGGILGNGGGGLDIRWPVPSCHTLQTNNGWGWRHNPVNRALKFHKGTDVPAAGGADVLAIANGKVRTSTFHDELGNYVVIEHSISGKGTYYSYYLHLRAKGASAGTNVKAGDVIGKVGTTGSSTGNHLHFDFMKTLDRSNKTINPTNHYDPDDKRNINNNGGRYFYDQPLFKKTGNTYAYNQSFDWSYSENPLPAHYSHSDNYSVY